MLTVKRFLVLFSCLAIAPFVLAGCGETKVSGTTKSGTKLSSSGSSLPKGWPQGLNAPSGAEVTAVISEDNTDTVSGTSTKDPIELAAQFKEALEADGWTRTSDSSDRNSISVEDWERGKEKAQVSTISANDGSTFTITRKR